MSLAVFGVNSMFAPLRMTFQELYLAMIICLDVNIVIYPQLPSSKVGHVKCHKTINGSNCKKASGEIASTTSSHLIL